MFAYIQPSMLKIPDYFIYLFLLQKKKNHYSPSWVRFGGRTIVGKSRSYLVSSEMFASSRIQFVDSNIFKSNGSPLSSPFIMVIEWQVAIPYSKWSHGKRSTSRSGIWKILVGETGTIPHISRPSSVNVPVYNRAIAIAISIHTNPFLLNERKSIKLKQFEKWVFTLSKQTQSILPATVIDLGEMQKILFFSRRFWA